MDLVYLYGPPGVGKLTTASHLAAITGFKLFHNHLSIDCVRPIFEFGTEPFWRVVHEIRCQVLAEAAEQGADLILTNVYWHPEDEERVARYFQAVEQHGGRVAPVQLWCESAILETRLEAPGRAEMGKLAAIERLRDLMTEHDLRSTLQGRASLSIDNTHLDPREVAELIVSHYQLQTQVNERPLD